MSTSVPSARAGEARTFFTSHTEALRLDIERLNLLGQKLNEIADHVFGSVAELKGEAVRTVPGLTGNAGVAQYLEMDLNEAITRAHEAADRLAGL